MASAHLDQWTSLLMFAPQLDGSWGGDCGGTYVEEEGWEGELLPRNKSVLKGRLLLSMHTF